MRIFPIALIVIGSLGLAKYFGLLPIGALHVIGPLLLIALGVALLLRRPRGCRGDWRARHHGRGMDAPQPPSAGVA
jgi:hypothetical protein